MTADLILCILIATWIGYKVVTGVRRADQRQRAACHQIRAHAKRMDALDEASASQRDAWYAETYLN